MRKIGKTRRGFTLVEMVLVIAIIVILAGIDSGKANIVCACGKAAVSGGAHAGKMVGKVAALTGGKGGGRPESAMAGVGDIAKIDDALAGAKDIAAEFVK